MELPSPTDLSPALLALLNEHFNSRNDLSRVPALVSKLKGDCVDLDRQLVGLRKQLASTTAAWISRSNDVDCLLRRISRRLKSFDLCLSSPGKKGEISLRRTQRIVQEELRVLAKEVVQIETIRAYAETTLHLEALVGDLEDDAVFSVVGQISRNNFAMSLSGALLPAVRPDFQWKQERLLLAIKAVKGIEEVLVNLGKSRPNWCHLAKAVDCRVDKTLANLRPQALADHRAILTSLGWPPPLSCSDKEDRLKIQNPLLLMHGDKKERYSESFLALSALQHLQARRESRQRNLLGHKNGTQLSDSAEPFNNRGLDFSLWTIDELVSPIASRLEHHFSRWSDQPRFVFALVYKVTRDFIGLDEVLQPLIDKARLVGYSAKEAWVSAMVKMLSSYLRKKIFSVLAETYNDQNNDSEIISSWLHLVDLIISFDKQMQALASSGMPAFVGKSSGFSSSSKGCSVLSIFCDHPEWVDVWAAIELSDAMEKLRKELVNDNVWIVVSRKEDEFIYDYEADAFLLSTRENHKAPLIVESVVQIAWTMIERCRMLPSVLLRVKFIRSSVSVFLGQFFNLLLCCCQELQALVSYGDEDTLVRIAALINAARYFVYILQEWSEDIDFLEMRIAEDCTIGQIKDVLDGQAYFFAEEMNMLINLDTDWVEEILAHLLRQFNTHCWDYIRNRTQWVQEEESCFDAVVSAGFVEALDMLRGGLQLLRKSLNSKDFYDLWRSVASGLDHYLFSGILLNCIKFSDNGIKQFQTDMRALFIVFRPFCSRPEAFFPCINNSMKLQAMGLEDAKHVMGLLSKGEKRRECLQMHGVFHVSPAQAEKILRNGKFEC
ncbi:hypothetical protein ACLOJK_000209 [Asimina triloba]